jgi:hypothetical protein
MAATVSSVVTANTFSTTANTSGEYLTGNSTGTSGNSTARATAVLYVQLVSKPLANRITINGNASINGSQFGGVPVGAVEGSVINNTTVTAPVGEQQTIGELTVNVINSTPIVNAYGLQQYASIELLYNNGSPELIIPPNAGYINNLYGVSPGTYTMSCTATVCTPTQSSENAFSTLGVTLSPKSVSGIKGIWTISGVTSESQQLDAFIYSDSNVNLDLSNSSTYISVVANGLIQTLTKNGNSSATNETYYPFATYPEVCSTFSTVCKFGAPIPSLLSVSLVSNSGINIANGTTIGGNIGSNGEVNYIGGGSHTVNGNIVATGVNVSSGSSISISGSTKGNLSSNNNTFGQQQISLYSLFWN